MVPARPSQYGFGAKTRGSSAFPTRYPVGFRATFAEGRPMFQVSRLWSQAWALVPYKLIILEGKEGLVGGPGLGERPLRRISITCLSQALALAKSPRHDASPRLACGERILRTPAKKNSALLRRSFSKTRLGALRMLRMGPRSARLSNFHFAGSQTPFDLSTQHPYTLTFPH